MSLKHGYCNKAMLKAMMSLLAVRKKGKLNKLYIRSYAHMCGAILSIQLSLS